VLLQWCCGCCFHPALLLLVLMLLLVLLSVVPSDMRDVMTSAGQHGKSQRQEDGDDHHLTKALEEFGHSHHCRRGAHGGNEPA
jgi:hypothetical protein